MQPLVIVQLLILLLVANGTPVIATRFFGDRLSYPIDCGVRYLDGWPLLGRSKTIRGVVLSILVTSACAPIVGLEWKTGALVGSAAMIGDLLSSFVKRRMHLSASSRATGLDQIPESLFPLLCCLPLLALTLADVIVGVALFFIREIALSRVLYNLRVRRHPY
jgi:CDP-2,3-bis-(O-geranylgeranyl)-sn-glycerol synthase